MKKLLGVVVLFTILSCKTEEPTQFTEAALNDNMITLDGSSIAFKDILKQYEGKTVFVDVWASWCGDCIKNMPKVKALQEKYTDVVYLFLSLDRGQKSWKKGIEKYNVQGEHYFIPSADDSAFTDFADVGWIPRYMVLGPQGNIKLFEAIEADDARIKENLINN
ncbi:TlpA disulfide reductase family protein [Tamlana crocina]